MEDTITIDSSGQEPCWEVKPLEISSFSIDGFSLVPCEPVMTLVEVGPCIIPAPYLVKLGVRKVVDEYGAVLDRLSDS